MNVHFSDFTDALQYVSKRLLYNFCPIDCTAIDQMLVTIISVRNLINKRVRPQRAPGRADSAFDLHDLVGDDHLRFDLDHHDLAVNVHIRFGDCRFPRQDLHFKWDRPDWLTCIRSLGQRSHGKLVPFIHGPNKFHYLAKERSMLAIECSMQRLTGTENLLERTTPTQQGRPQPRHILAPASAHALGSLVHPPEHAGVLHNVPQMTRHGELHHQP